MRIRPNARRNKIRDTSLPLGGGAIARLMRTRGRRNVSKMSHTDRGRCDLTL